MVKKKTEGHHHFLPVEEDSFSSYAEIPGHLLLFYTLFMGSIYIFKACYDNEDGVDEMLRNGRTI